MRARQSAQRRTAVPLFIVAALLAGAVLRPIAGAADGALAVGLPPDVAAEGFAYGYALNKSSAVEARSDALKDCKAETPGVDKRAQALCAVVQAFRNQCFAVAMDPKDATPGVGWAIGADKATASREALAKCAATAGEDRRNACKVTDADCDTQ